MNILQPEPGLYRHYKGGQYRVLGTARHSENDDCWWSIAACTTTTRSGYAPW